MLAEKEAELASSAPISTSVRCTPTASASRRPRCARRSRRSRTGSTTTRREAQEIGERLDRERKDAGDGDAELKEERGRVESSATASQLERALVAQTTEAEILARRVQELEGRMAEQVRALAEREIEITSFAKRSPRVRRSRPICAPNRSGEAAAATRPRTWSRRSARREQLTRPGGAQPSCRRNRRA